MYKIYFKQAVEMLKQNKFFSIISITGTALAIMMIMAIIVTDSVKNVSVAPENNRDRTLYLTFQEVTWMDSLGVNRGSTSGSLEIETVKKYISQMETPVLISAYADPYRPVSVSTDVSTEDISLKRLFTDPAYWKILSFSFIEGRAFNEEEFLSEISNAVISESAAKKLFRGEPAIGQTININLKPYRVIGIVKDVSPVFRVANADIWTPYTPDTKGGYTALLLTKSKKDIALIKEELRKTERKFQDSERTKTILFTGPKTHRIQAMGIWGSSDDEIIEEANTQNRKIWFILIVILLVPAVNLSGLNLSRIKKRTPEIGVRKAFGAKRHIILIQVLCENLITSLTGGIIGLILSVIVLFQMRNWLLGIPPDSAIPFSTIFSIPVILSVFAAVILINILAAAIPAYRASRMTIVNSITNNDKLS